MPCGWSCYVRYQLSTYFGRHFACDAILSYLRILLWLWLWIWLLDCCLFIAIFEEKKKLKIKNSWFILLKMKTKQSPVDAEPENQHIDCHNVIDMNKNVCTRCHQLNQNLFSCINWLWPHSRSSLFGRLISTFRPPIRLT